MAGFIEAGMAAFMRWGAPRPMALRTGNLAADMAVYRAMTMVGMGLSSNLGIAYTRPAEPDLQFNGGIHRIGDVMEVPVLSYAQLTFGRRRWLRLLTITATSWPEMRALLWKARSAGISPIVILTHPFEFIKGRDDRKHANATNKTRLRQLCAFIAANGNDFVSRSFGRAESKWRSRSEIPSPDIRAPLIPVLARMIENKLNDLLPG
jgi:hypothetical protein